MIDAFLELAKAQLDNQFMTGGLTIVVFTALLALMRNLPVRIWDWLERRVITTVDVTDHDPAFFWIQQWLAKHEYTRERARLLTASTHTCPVDGGAKPSPVGAEGSGSRGRRLIEVVFSPAPGLHIFRFRGSWLLLSRTRREVDNSMGAAYHETFTFRTFSREVVRELIYEAREAAFPPEDNTIGIMRAQGWSWKLMQRRLPRALDSVVTNGAELRGQVRREGIDVVEEVVKDVTWFFGASDWYAEHGIPYQRGYLLIGPPGNGKSSLAIAIASAFGRDIHIISLAGLGDDAFMSLMSEVPKHSIVLIEDADCAYDQRKRDQSTFLSFSGFLNAIDGVAAPPGRVLFMTTNHPDKLDAAIKRPGRADRTFELGNATPDQAERLFLRFFPGQSTAAEEFAGSLGDDPVSMATLQEHLIIHRDNPSLAARLE